MAISLFRRGNTATNNSYKGVNGEVTINTTTKAIRIHDGITTGGFEGARRDLTNILPTGPINFNGQAITNVVVDTTGALTVTSLQTDNISSVTEGGTLTFNSPTNFDSVVNINNDLKLNSYGLDTVTLSLNHDNNPTIAMDSKTGNVNISGITNLAITSLNEGADVYGDLTLLNNSNFSVLNDQSQVVFSINTSSATTAVNGTLDVNDIILVDNISELTLNHGVYISNNTTINGSISTDAFDSSSSLTDISSNVTNITSNTINIVGYVSQIGDFDITGNFTIDGNFSIQGTLSTLHSQNLSVKDTLILLNDEIGNADPINDSGVIIDRGSQDNAGMFWSESQHKFAFITATSINGSSVGNLLTTGGTVSYAGLLAGSIDLKDTNGNTSFSVNNAGDVHVYGDLILDGGLTGNASTATAWASAMTLSLIGDVTGSVSFNGGTSPVSMTTSFGTITLGTDTTGAYVQSVSAGTGISISGTASIPVVNLATSGVSANTYKSVTVDTYGRVTAGTNPTSLSGYGITDAQPLDATLTALASVSTTANKLIYADGVDSFTTTDLSAFGRSLIDDASASASRSTLGLVIGTDVQAYDATLNALASVVTSANKLIYADGIDSFTTTDLSAFGRSLIDDADANTARTTLGLGTASVENVADLLTKAGNLSGLANTTTARSNLGLVIGTNVQAYDATLNALAGLTTVADQTIYSTGADTFAMTTLSSFGRSLIDDTDASTARSTLGLVIGTNVQAYDATLAGLASVTTSADTLIYATNVDTFTTTTLSTFIRTLLDDADATTARTTLGLAIGTNVQAWDADLDAIAALSGTAGYLKKTAANTWSLDNVTFVDTSTTQSSIGGAKTFTAGVTFSSTVALGSSATAFTQSANNNSTAVATTAYVDSAVSTTPISQKTANYTLVLTDAGKMIEFNSASNLTLTIPANSSVAFPVGTQILIGRLGSGKVNVAITTDTLYSVSIGGVQAKYLSSQYSGATLVKNSSTSWYLFGDLSAT
jgi:hypothetical protein